MLLVASWQNTNAQCLPFYQHIESVSPTATWQTQMVSDGWEFTPTDALTGFVLISRNTSPSLSKSGTYSLASRTPNKMGQFATPKIQSPNLFSFWVLRTNTSADSYTVEVTNNGGTTWNLLSNGANSLYTTTITASLPSPVTVNAWYQVTVSGAFPAIASPGGYQFRITDDRIPGENGAMVFDDLSWSSSIPSQNTIILPDTNTTSACNFTIADGIIYTLYDNGANDLYNVNQFMNDIALIPANPAAKIQITFEEFGIRNSLGAVHYLQVFNSSTYTSQLGTNLSGFIPPPDLTSTAANGGMSFKFRSDAIVPTTTSYGFKIKVEAVRCTIPNTLAGAGTYNQANLTWVGSPSAVQYEVYQSTTATPVPVFGTVGTLTGSTTASYSATGLTAGTTYYYWVRSICAGDKSGWAGPVAVVPICSPVSVPYLENFNGYAGGVLPPCTSATSTSWQTNAVNGNLYSNGEFTSFFTRGISLTAGQLYRISYDYSAFGPTASEANLQVAIGTTNVAPTESNITDFTKLSERNFIPVNIQSSIENFTAPTTGTYYIRFFLNDVSAPSVALNLDNIKVEVETCLPPTIANNYTGPNTTSLSPYLTGVTDFTADISWNVPVTGVPSSGYLYYVNTSNTPPAYLATPTGSASGNSVTINSLSPNTRYFVWVRADCGGQISTWSLNFIQLFTTNVTSPVSVKISDIEPIPATGTTLALNSGCNFNFSDSGGPTGNYGNNENYTYTFRPATPGKKLKVVFSTFNVEESWDGLMIYSGDNSSGNTLSLMSSGRPAGIVASCPAGSYRGTDSPGTIISNSANGSLSFTFTTDYSVTPSGWTATIFCVDVPTINTFTPTNNGCGATNTVVITGLNFTGATGVFFGSLPATSFVVNSSTQITAVAPATGTLFSAPIKVVNPNAFGFSISDFTLQPPPPVTTAATICVGGTGALTSAAVCSGYTNAVTTFQVTLGASPTATRPNSSGNSMFCSFAGGSIRSYTSTDFQVSVSGIYVFSTNTGPDLMGYIARSPFTAGTCSTNFVIGDDDSGPGLNPQMTVNLTAGVTYTIFTTSWLSGITGTYDWNVVPPSGGNVLLFQTSQVAWYTTATGGTPIYSGASFNPVGYAGSGIVNNTTPITKTYYAACSTNATCRTATIFTIANPGTIAPATQTISCTGTVVPLVLTGNTSPVIKWQYNATDATFATGVTVNIPLSNVTTLTTAQIGTFAGTRYYRAETNGVCLGYSNSATITFDRAVWNAGAWTGTPSATSAVEFQSNYSSTASLDACSVTVTGGNVVFNTNHTLTVQNAVTVTGGTLTFEDESSLYQPNPATNAPTYYNGGNAGNISYKRTSTPMYKLDYTYWSTPVSPQNLLAISPSSPQNYFLEYTGTAWAFVSPSATTMRPGKGYLVRAPWFFPDGTPSLPQEHTATFTGVPNNGAINIPVIGGAGQLNLIGNPYPSAISAFPTSPGLPATGFSTANTNLKGSLYFWTHNTPLGVFAWGQYNPNDYAIYNLTGASTPAATGTGNNSIPTGIIGSGQGFFVEGLSTPASNANFTNAMRRPTGNASFFKNSSPVASTHASADGLEKHRYWLDITNSANDFKQVLIGYVEGATNGLDRLYDATMVDIDSKVTIYTKVEGTHLTIQGKDLAFNVDEQIALYFNCKTADNFTIKLSDFDGLFVDQNIYLDDTTLNVIHDLKQSPYTFASEQGLFESRFKVRYTTSALGVNDSVFNENSVIVYNNEQGLFINSGAVSMKNITIYDVAGRLIAAKTNVNNVSAQFTNLPKAQQVLLVKIESENGITVTKKVVF
ncbi:T9SS sorting signal type C domain-containing protein [Flavobacterium sp.]